MIEPRAAAETLPAPDEEDAPAARRTQVERSARTRSRLIAAAFDLLRRQGYSGATTLAVARHAGVSLGALQHQFPTKALLMTAVLRRATAERIRRYRLALRGVPAGMARFEALARVSWSMIGSAEIIASIEIELASRKDAELAAVAAPTFARHAAFLRRLVTKILSERLPATDPRIESVRLLNNAVLIGLSMEVIRSTDPAAISRALELWRSLMMGTIEREL